MRLAAFGAQRFLESLNILQGATCQSFATFVFTQHAETQEMPPEVVCGDPAESCEEFVDCFDTEVEAVLDALNYALKRDGFMSITP
jgi:hypothetical protein